MRLLFVIEADRDVGQHQMAIAQKRLKELVDEWSAGDDPNLVVTFGHGFRLKVYQPDGEMLSGAPRVEVKYTSDER